MRHLLRQTALIAMKSGLDRYGNPTFGSAISVPCRADRVHKRQHRMREGQAQVEDVIVEIEMLVINDDGNLDSLATGDKVTFAGKAYRIHTLYEGRDSFGVEAYKTLSLIPWQT